MSKLLRILIPTLILLSLLGLLWYELFHAKPSELPSALIGEKVPSFQLENILNTQSPFTQQDLKGHVILLNVWATWCYACQLETDMLMKIKNTYHVPIFAIDYKDEKADAQAWLQKYGNPYVKIGDDKHGDVAIDFGVYGTPETFVISPQGEIVYRHIGVIDQQVWDEVLYPLVKKYES